MADKTPSIMGGQSIRKTHTHKQCPICKKNVVSDASKPLSCALCGMVVDAQNMFLCVEDGEEKYFCLHGCYEKYNQIHSTEEKINGV